jgi:osmoprotectant transport system substrate-binding protein
MPAAIRTRARVPRLTGGAAALAIGSSLMLAACTSGSAGGASTNPLAPSAAKSAVVVGSANFPENELLAEIYLLALQGKGIKATAKFNIGSREICYPEIEKGAITVIPEYNGALLTTEVDTTSTAASTMQVDAALAARLPASLAILAPSAAQDKDSVTVTRAFAARHHLTSLASLAPIAPAIVIGGPPEFKTRADGLPGLKKNYGLTFKGFTPLDESGPITLAALLDGDVQAADVFTTIPQITTDHLVALSDPDNNFAAQNVLPLVYRKGVTPAVINALDGVSAKLTTAGLLAMNKQVIINHANYATVAAAWLRQQDLS